MSTNAFIFHGTGGYPEENWFPWLKTQLENQQPPIHVTIPAFPTPEGQSLEAWLKILEPYLPQITTDTILIGHSLGGAFLLRLLERLPHPVKAAIFVAAPVGIQPIKFYDADSKFLQGFDFNWPLIKSRAHNFTVFHSDNDPYVSLGNGEELAKRLGVELSFIPNSGHFNASAGFTEFGEILNKVNEV